MVSFWRGSSRGRKQRVYSQTYSAFAGSPETSRNRVTKYSIGGEEEDDDDVDENDNDDDNDEGDRNTHPEPAYRARGATTYRDAAHAEHYDEEQEEGEDGAEEDAPLLPIFSAAHLDKLPLYNTTHAIRLLIVQRCETTLSWDQLRSPQVSQFLVKPIQGQIRTNHFNRATLCALIANCLQFYKEGHLHPGNVGVSKTRALISELLAMRLIKEYTTRELIDALSYDFDPLQGISPPATGVAGQVTSGRATPGASLDVTSSKPRARVNTIEIAIRAQAKRFLAHALVVQHLEAIWAGTVVFHSEADNLHRRTSAGDPPPSRAGGYGTLADRSPSAPPAGSRLAHKTEETRANKQSSTNAAFSRRSVTLYDPRDASLFKLSRLRVPRYRQIFSTLSFATLLGLFLAVLYQRSLYITPLEVVFWFWSAGYMLDEIVGFSEQGFGLYILSFWNAFDLGILLLFIVYYCLRLYGIVLADQGRHQIANYAYDVLASTAILLFPRLFSVLDHYRYFSQLLIAFRMMAQDLLAILVLILISCSGFFVAFTLSFADEQTNGNAVAYALFQILMGFTPAAWDKWSGFNMLGKAIMTIFLVMCHFLIVTILITVLTNSFMAIVRNANEEHQFVFAVNTISMVKSDALFSYIAPTNVFGWALSPLRYAVSFRQYLRLNRTVIKVTHFPVLFAIFSYERVILSKAAYEPTDLIEKPFRTQGKPMALSIHKTQDLFSPVSKPLESSVIGSHKDRALDEVFRRPFRGDTVRTTAHDMEVDRRNSTTAVDKWMQVAENEGGASPPLEQPRSVLELLEHRRPPLRRAATTDKVPLSKRSREFSVATRSLASEPDIISTIASRRPYRIDEETEDLMMSQETLPQETDADGDDENNEGSDNAEPKVGESVSIFNKENRTQHGDSDEEEFFQTPTAGRPPTVFLSAAARARHQHPSNAIPAIKRPANMQPQIIKSNKNVSTGMSLFTSQDGAGKKPASAHPWRPFQHLTARNVNSGNAATLDPIDIPSGQRTPKMKPIRSRPIMPPRQVTLPNASKVGLSFLDVANRDKRSPSFNARALDLASDIGDNRWGPSGGIDAGGISGMPASFSEQLLREREIERRVQEERRRSEEEEKGMVNRIVLARMNTLEEGFREVLKEIKVLSHSHAGSRRDSDNENSQPMYRVRSERTRADSSTSGSMGRGGKLSRTPVKRFSGGEDKERKNPRKGQRRNITKGKEIQRSVDVVRRVEPGDSGLRNFESTAARPENAQLETMVELDRPNTAVQTSRPSREDEL